MAALLLTRPVVDSEAWAGQLAEQGIEAIVSPLLRIEYLDCGIIDWVQYEGAIFTSYHAIIGKYLPQTLPLYLVGERSAAYARQQGASDIRHIAQDAESLRHYLQQQKFIKPLLYLSGDHMRVDMPERLGNLKVERRVCYLAHAAETLTDKAQSALESGGLDGVALFSPRTAEIFHRLTTSALRAGLTAFCLSAPIADICRAAGGWKGIYHAAKPDGESLELLIMRHYR